MESYEKSFNIVCRLCLKYDDSIKNTSLVDSVRKSGLSAYGEILKKVTSLDIDFNDKLPKNICFDCKNELNKFECFKLMCKTNCERLNSFINDYKKKTSDEVDMAATMFTKYFPDRYQEFYSKMAIVNILKIHVKEENLTNDTEPSTIDSNATLSFKDNMVVPKVEIDHSHTVEPKVKVEIDDDSQTVVPEVKIEIDDSHTVEPKVEIEIQCIHTNTVSDQNKSQNTPTKGESQSRTKTIEGLGSLLNQLGALPKQKRQQLGKAQNQNRTCSVCNKKILKNFKLHMLSHKKPNACNLCGKRFSTVIYMKKHQITHHGGHSSFECDNCSFRAPSQRELIEHIRLHTGERPFTCEKCGLTFRRKYIYRRHLKCHDEKTVQCPKCPMKFYLPFEMKAHMNNKHERVCLYLCHICNNSYTKTVSVRKHLQTEHGIVRENQGKIMRVTKETHGELFKESRRRWINVKT